MLEKALEEGYVQTKWTKVSLTGPPGSGKSSALRLLLNKKPVLTHHSTPAVTEAQVRKVETTSVLADESSWEKVDNKSLKNMVAGAIKSGIVSAGPSRIQLTNIPHLAIEETTNSQQKISASKVLHVPAVSHGATNVINHPAPIMTNCLATVLPTAKKSDALSNAHWVYVVDTGGQAAFLDVAPALLRYNSVNIVTHKLNEKLSDKISFIYRVEGKLVGNPIKRDITHLQLLETSVRSVTCFQSLKFKHILEQTPNSVLVLGTFYDEIAKSGESLKQKNLSLASLFSQKGISKAVMKNGANIIFPVNAIAREQTEIDMAAKIRHKICKSYIEANIPLRWYSLQLEFEQLQSQVVTKSACIEIGISRCHITEIEVEAALKYFHDLTVILYFHDVIPDLVFLHPQPLFKKLSELISVSFADGVQYLDDIGIDLPDDAHEMLKVEGQFTRDLLNSLSADFTADYTVAKFLKLMESLFIIGYLPKMKRYFIPCVLPTTEDSSLKEHYMNVLDPLVFTWDMKPIPQGLVPALVVQLLQQNLHNELPLFELHSQEQYHNAIQLLICSSLGGSVLLVDSIYWLEVYCTSHNNCHTIRQVIKYGIEEVVKKFQYDPIPPTECFLCTKQHDDKLHLCYLSDDKMSLTCRDVKRPLSSSIDKDRQSPWLKQSKDLQYIILLYYIILRLH